MSSDDEENTAWDDYWLWLVWGVIAIAGDFQYSNGLFKFEDLTSSPVMDNFFAQSPIRFVVYFGVFGFSLKNIVTCRIGWVGRMFFVYHAIRAAHHVGVWLGLFAGIVNSQIPLATFAALDLFIVALFFVRIRVYDRSTSAQTG